MTVSTGDTTFASQLSSFIKPHSTCSHCTMISGMQPAYAGTVSVPSERKKKAPSRRPMGYQGDC